MAEANETIAAIVAEMRKRKDMLANAAYSSPLCYSVDTMLAQAELLDEFTDRLEAAWKREREAVEADALSVGGFVEAARHRPGNAAAMREALEFADRELRMATESDRYGDDLVYLVGCMRSVASVCRTALAAPARNCDVGTPKEQKVRLVSWCESHGHECEDCPLRAFRESGDCGLEWMQMPYTEGES